MTETEKELFCTLVTLLDVKPEVIHDPDDPMAWSVWWCDDILGAGDACSEALAEALDTVRGWEP